MVTRYFVTWHTVDPEGIDRPDSRTYTTQSGANTRASASFAGWQALVHQATGDTEADCLAIRTELTSAGIY